MVTEMSNFKEPYPEFRVPKYVYMSLFDADYAFVPALVQCCVSEVLIKVAPRFNFSWVCTLQSRHNCVSLV